MMHLSILHVVIPLLTAPLCLIINRSKLCFVLSLAACAVATVISAMLLFQVLQTGSPVTYEVGGWAPDVGIEYRIDNVSAYLLVLLSSIATIVLFSAATSIEQDIPAGRHVYFYVAYLLCLAGMMGIVSSGDIFNIFVFLEISALSSYVLIAIGRDRVALWGAFQYLMLGTIGATFLLIGIGLLFAKTGSLNLQEISARLALLEDSRTVVTAFTFLLTGLLLKMGLFPLHQWLPNAYAYAPSVVGAFLAATATKTAIYLFVRFTWTLFGVEFSFSALPLQYILVTLGLLAIFVGSFTAIVQENVRRLLAWSSIAQIGYMVVGLGLASAAGLTATLVHMFNHAVIKASLFLALGAVMYRIGSVRLDDLAGISRQMPWTCGAIVFGGLGLIGVPLTAGFISKWLLISAIAEQGWWVLAIAILLSSLLSAIYVWRIVEACYFKEPKHEAGSEAPLSLLVPLWILVAANLWLGLDTRLTTSISEVAAASLMGMLP